MRNTIKLSTASSVLLLMCACGETAITPPQPFPEADSPAAKLLVSRCGGCHGAPSPNVHIALEWPSVIYRMQGRMAQKGIKTLSTDEQTLLVDYLQKYARGAS